MDKKQSNGFKVGTTRFTFWCEVYFHYRRIKTFSAAARNARRCRIQIINDELYLDGNARQNTATFCQTGTTKMSTN